MVLFTIIQDSIKKETGVQYRIVEDSIVWYSTVWCMIV